VYPRVSKGVLSTSNLINEVNKINFDMSDTCLCASVTLDVFLFPQIGKVTADVSHTNECVT